MDKQQAQNIIKETFENPFDKDRFTGFAKNLLNQIDDSHFAYYGKFIPDAYKPFISRYERIGKYSDSENRIDILVVYLNKETSIERARTRQRNFIAGYLEGKYGSDVSKDAALVAFVSPNEDDWRFSLVKMDYKFEQTESGKMKVKEEFSPARRWSFLVGKNESSHTAQSRLVPILTDDEHDPTLARLEEAFNIEKVTKEFFEKYRDLFLRTKETLDEIVTQDSKIKADFEIKGVDTVNFAKKLLGQIVFLYFLQKKGWFGVERDAEWGTGTKHFLRELFSRRDEFPKGGNGKHTNFFNDILEPLFYEALRIDRRHDDDYYKYFNSKIPFLNGGLFDPINNYDWVHTDILLPNELFSNRTKTKEGDTGNGILDVFDRYNFTVKEDEPLEKEVAVDPEMLGKVFENLLEVKDRKSKGTYYTPREIVHYMCQQSLINYLHTELNSGTTSYQNLGDDQLDMLGNKGKKTQLDLTIENKPKSNISKEEIETLIHTGEQVGENEATVEARGKETDTYSYKLPESIRKHAQLIDEKLASIKVCDPAIGSGAFPVGMMHEIVKTRNVLTTFLNPPLSSLDKGKMKGELRTIYRFKRECIEKSLYGVDIDPGAVEIAKLRLWLSLVVDEDDIKQIKPLPNLDYKIVCGNSLLGVKRDLLNDYLFKELEQLKPLYFNETNPTKKQEYKQQIDDLISRITDGHKEFDFEIYFSEIFRLKGGFDVVIANPPYDVIKDKKLRELFNDSIYGRANLYGLFIHKAIRDILRKDGILTFINPKTLLADMYSVNLRKFLKNNGEFIEIMKITDRHNIFDDVLQACIIQVYRKTKPHEDHQILIAEIAERNDIGNLGASLTIPKKKVYQTQQYNDCFLCASREQVYSIWEKVSKATKPLSYFGFSFTTGKIQWDLFKNELTEKPDSNAVRLIWAENVQRYLFKNTEKRKGKEYIKNPPIAPSITTDTIITQRTTADEQEYRIISTIFSPSSFGFKAFSENHTNYLEKKSNTLQLYYILACLNSKLYDFIFRQLSSNTQVSSGQLNSLPFLGLPMIQQIPFTILVNRILAITKDEDYLQNPQKQAQVKTLEREIDRMVYKLYDLTEEEIVIVEENVGKYKYKNKGNK